VLYTPAERLDLAERLARAATSLSDVEDQKKASDASHKEIVEGLKLEMKRLSRRLTSGNEMRNVSCEWLLGDPTPKEKTLVRKDTGEVVRVMPMQDHDYQEELPGAVPAGTNETLVLEPPPSNGIGPAAAAQN
jgi:hypothetical protein